ncbi:lipid A export permease/ATP-binding protein MsbA [Methylotenera sp.]|uniref:lipid A export permease/ATP-binding protein MsbA n=1 Tax=Methylotenera sp. TaxID=2051956 RepID=UPI00272EFBB3|nr:lipid A export permease/ATP-binding protein MsbA [Methylotenera sp.]MDP2070380.1 lipid A export permease/ATP-binding protein MsbA [Methylotenera sp.]MDP3005683.1 lipid A export permease/ATP-binding protein MsbA [Methylotenera sp.]
MSKSNIKETKRKLQMTGAPNSKILYLRLFRYAWKYKAVFLGGVLALIALSASNTAFLATIKQVTDEGFVKQSADKVAYLPFMLFGLLALRALAGFISSFSMRLVARRVVADLRLDTFRQLMRLPVSFFDEQSAGIVISKLTYDVEQMANAATKSALTLVRDTLTAIGIVGYMLYLDWRLTMIFALIAPIMAFYLKTMTPQLRNAGKEVQSSIGEMTKVAEEAVSGQRIVKIFGAQAYENERFAKVVGKNRHMQIRLARLSSMNSMVVELLAAVSLGMVVYYAVGRFSAGEFAAFVGALLMLIAPIKNLTAMNEDVQVALAAAQSVFGVIDIKPELDEGDKAISRSKGEIEFKHVNLTYNNAKRPALNDISFNIRPGEKLALVGRSGGGKTSLVNLLPRFYELQQGQVLLDGVDMRTLPLADLRQQFSLVSQDVILFNDTVFNNIAYGVLRNSSEEEVINAAKAAHAWDFIQQLPKGLQNEIGDRGVRLSGGQRQRIAIARAILKNAPILLLDEATSALDTESEQHVQAALDKLMHNRTSIVIAHRLSTVENADRIMVMEHGEIVESGTHDVLIKQGGHYAKLYQKQFS